MKVEHTIRQLTKNKNKNKTRNQNRIEWANIVIDTKAQVVLIVYVYVFD